MTDELKTLRDIEREQQITSFTTLISKEDLKQEAIKWMKSCHICSIPETFPCYNCKRFMHFFNITEDDLK